MARCHRLVFTITQMLAHQPVMLDIINDLQIKYSHQRLQDKQQYSGKTANKGRQQQACRRPGPVKPKRVGPITGLAAALDLALSLDLECRHKTADQCPGQEMIDIFVISGGDHITRGADIAVVHQNMLGAKMAVKHRGQQDIAQCALEFVALVDQLMGIGNTNPARNHPRDQHQQNALPD